jgi:hypothetical protein
MLTEGKQVEQTLQFHLAEYEGFISAIPIISGITNALFVLEIGNKSTKLPRRK